jgi:hypothetical protein
MSILKLCVNNIPDIGFEMSEDMDMKNTIIQGIACLNTVLNY